MRMIVCEECQKRYDYDRDDFCPRCGAFNQPVKTWGVDAKGNVIRVDGVNEQNHAGSFAHKEVHTEKNQRRSSGLDWRGAAGGRTSTVVAAPPRPAARPSTAGKRPGSGGTKARQSALVKGIVTAVAVIILINIILTILTMLFSWF